PVLLVRRANNTEPLVSPSRFSWVFFLATKDETASVLKAFIVGLKSLLCLKFKIIRCDNGTEFKNADLNQYCRVLVTKPHNKTPYELLHGRLPSIGFMRPFGCPVTILNTLDPLGKFQRKVNKGFLVGYSVCSKAFRVFNSRNRIVQETLHVNFMENKPNVAGSGPAWLFDIDSLSQTMNYHPVLAENQTNSNAGFQDLKKAGEEGTQTYVLFPVLSDGSTNPKNNKDVHTSGNKHNDDFQKSVSPDFHSSSCGDLGREQGDKAVNKDKGKNPVVTITGFKDLNKEFAECINNSSNGVSAAGPSVSAAGLEFTNSTNNFTAAGPLVSAAELNFINNTNDFSADGPSNAAMPNLEDLSHNADDVGAEADTNNMESKISIEAMQEELLQFKMQKVWILVDLPYGKRAIGTKWVYRNKKDERGIVIRNKARLVTQGYTQEEGIDYEETNIVDLSKHTTRYISPVLTQKVFTNMRRVGKEPAVEEVATDVVPPTPTSPSPSSPVIPSLPPHQPPCSPQPQDAEGSSLFFQRVLDTCSALVLRVEGLENDKTAQQLEIVKLKARVKKLEKINKVKSSKLRRLKKVGTSQPVESSDDVENVFNQGRKIVDMDQDEGIELVANQKKDAEVEGRHADKQEETYNIDLDHSSKVLSMQEDDTEVQEAVEVVTTAKLMTEVVTAATTQVVAASIPIPVAKPKTLIITAAPAVSTRRRKGVVIRDPEEELSSDTPTETPKVKDKGKGILIEAPNPIKKKEQIEMDAEYARKLQEEINKEHEEAYKNID
nr:putative ribonuclease H-like domain-containing protein [Tanacetum cinerariifolium]